MQRSSEPRVAVVTHFPSPYQVELFDAVARRIPGELAVHYLHRRDPARHWAEASLGHAASFVGDGGSAWRAALEDMARARVVVLHYYQDRRALALMKARAAARKPWCFWGERPGFRHPRLGRWLRRGLLGPLHASSQPIWGIGEWALEAYRAEFGQARPYVNVPYFSDLARFSRRPASASDDATILYSGALTRRKGVDLLARAFVDVARSDPRVRLKVMGAGELEGEMRGILEPLGERVEWVGFKPWDELAGVYASAQVLCAPSRHDGWGLVVAEGLAAGLPVIATDRTGAAIDLVRPGANGWICRAGDGAALAAAMREAARLDAGAWQVMSAAARASVARHTLDDGAERFLAAVNCAIEVTAPAGRS